MSQLIKKSILFIGLFLAGCAVLSFAGGILGYILSAGSTPEMRLAASRLLIDSWGSTYTWSVMGLAAFAAGCGVISFGALRIGTSGKAKKSDAGGLSARD